MRNLDSWGGKDQNRFQSWMISKFGSRNWLPRLQLNYSIKVVNLFWQLVGISGPFRPSLDWQCSIESEKVKIYSIIRWNYLLALFWWGIVARDGTMRVVTWHENGDKGEPDTVGRLGKRGRGLFNNFHSFFISRLSGWITTMKHFFTHFPPSILPLQEWDPQKWRRRD